MEDHIVSSEVFQVYKNLYVSSRLANEFQVDPAVECAVLNINRVPDVATLFSCAGHLPPDSAKPKSPYIMMICSSEKGVQFVQALYAFMIEKYPEDVADLGMYLEAGISFPAPEVRLAVTPHIRNWILRVSGARTRSRLYRAHQIINTSLKEVMPQFGVRFWEGMSVHSIQPCY